MGSYFTRTRAWVYIAFYDEYVGRHINTCAGASILFFIPCYLYGIHINRLTDQNCNHMLYQWHYFDKRNRLTHNVIMEHFEVHKEKTEDLILELNEKGPVIFEGLEREKQGPRPITMNDLALIDEVSGLNEFLENLMLSQNFPQATRDKIRARMHEYSGPEPKSVALNRLSMDMFGSNR